MRSMALPMALSDSPRLHRSQIAALSLSVILDRRTRGMIPPIIRRVARTP